MKQKVFERICPKCACTIRYSSDAAMHNAARDDAKCRTCAHSIRHRDGGPPLEEQEAILLKHSEGLSNRSIERALGLTHNSKVPYTLKKYNLTANGPKKKHLALTANGAICSKCGKEKPRKEFRKQRAKKEFPYKLSYCLSCRRLQMYQNINKSVRNYIANKVHTYRARTIKFGKVFDLDVDYLLGLYKNQDGKCFYTDKVLRCGAGFGRHPESFSIDRIKSDVGYIKGNVVLCGARINTIKSDVTIEELKQWMPDWYNRLQVKGLIKQ